MVRFGNRLHSVASIAVSLTLDHPTALGGPTVIGQWRVVPTGTLEFGVTSRWAAAGASVNALYRRDDNVLPRYSTCGTHVVELQHRVAKHELFKNYGASAANIIYTSEALVPRPSSANPDGSGWTLTAPSHYFVDASTGDMIFRLPDPGRYLLRLHARLMIPGRPVPKVLVREWEAEFAPGDTCDPVNGPNGRGCVHGSEPVDLVQFDGEFSCRCARRDDWTGPNCDVPAHAEAVAATPGSAERVFQVDSASAWRALAWSALTVLGMYAAIAGLAALTVYAAVAVAWFWFQRGEPAAVALGLVQALRFAATQAEPVQRAGDRPRQPLPSTDATMLHFTALTGSVEGLQRAAVQFPHFVAMPNADGCTPLFLAARANHPEIIAHLATLAPETIAAPDDFGQTPLHIAATWGCVGAVKQLLELGAAVDAADGTDGLHPLHCAMAVQQAGDELAGWQSVEVARVLLADGHALVDARDSNGNTPLHTLVLQNPDRRSVAFVAGKMDLLVEHGADINAVDQYGETPLFQWCSQVAVPADRVDLDLEPALSARMPVVGHLLRHGADVAIQTRDGASVATLAGSRALRGMADRVARFDQRELFWHPVRHRRFPPLTRATVRCVLLAGARDASRAGADAGAVARGVAVERDAEGTGGASNCDAQSQAQPPLAGMWCGCSMAPVGGTGCFDDGARGRRGRAGAAPAGVPFVPPELLFHILGFLRGHELVPRPVALRALWQRSRIAGGGPPCTE